MAQFQHHLAAFLIGIFLTSTAWFFVSLQQHDNQLTSEKMHQYEALDDSLELLKDQDIKNLHDIKDPQELQQRLAEIHEKMFALIMQQLGLKPNAIPGPMALAASYEEPVEPENYSEEESGLEVEESVVEEEATPVPAPPIAAIAAPPVITAPENNNKKSSLYREDSNVLQKPKAFLKKVLPVIGKNKMLESINGHWMGDIQLDNGQQWSLELNLKFALKGKLYFGEAKVIVRDQSQAVRARHKAKGANQSVQRHARDPEALVIQLSKSYFLHLVPAKNKKSISGLLYKYKNNTQDFGRHGEFLLERALDL